MVTLEEVQKEIEAAKASYSHMQDIGHPLKQITPENINITPIVQPIPIWPPSKDTENLEG